MANYNLRQVRQMYGSFAFLKYSRKEREALRKLTGIVLSKEDAIKLRRFYAAWNTVGFCDAMERREKPVDK